MCSLSRHTTISSHILRELSVLFSDVVLIKCRRKNAMGGMAEEMGLTIFSFAAL